MREPEFLRAEPLHFAVKEIMPGRARFGFARAFFRATPHSHPDGNAQRPSDLPAKFRVRIRRPPAQPVIKMQRHQSFTSLGEIHMVEFEIEGVNMKGNVSTGKMHDFKLFQKSRLSMVSQTQCLADSGYLGLKKHHANSRLPDKKSKLHPLTKEQIDLIPNDQCKYCLPDCKSTIYRQYVSTVPF